MNIQLFLDRIIPYFGLRFAGVIDLNLSFMFILDLFSWWFLKFDFSNVFLLDFSARA